ncbi:MAG TPA: inositol monophosphatase family protein [Chitinophagales bacterium]|nr:inositol monophosphatase family protein [Chitinophagales bacterium]
MNLHTITEQTIEVAKQAGAFIREQAATFDAGAVQTKSLNSLVSYVDIESEKMLVKGLKEILPEASFLTEEQTVATSNTEYRWIIDPLDGTTNFIHKVPVYSVSVALYKGDDALVGVVYEVNRDECFSAFRHGGALCNGNKIEVTKATKLADTLIATGFPFEDFKFIDKYAHALRNMMIHTRGVRRLGSAAADLAYVAMGRFDGFFEYNLNAWDVAAGILLVKEAGGVVSDFSNGDDFLFGREILACAPRIKDEMLQQFNNA